MRPAPVCLCAVLLARPVGSHHPARYGVGQKLATVHSFRHSGRWLISPTGPQRSAPFVSVLGFFPAGPSSLGRREPQRAVRISAFRLKEPGEHRR